MEPTLVNVAEEANSFVEAQLGKSWCLPGWATVSVMSTGDNGTFQKSHSRV